MPKTRSTKRLAIAAGLSVRHNSLPPVQRPPQQPQPQQPQQQPPPQPQQQPPQQQPPQVRVGTLTRTGKLRALAAGLPVRHHSLPPIRRLRIHVPYYNHQIGAKTRSRKRMAINAGLNVHHISLTPTRRPRIFPPPPPPPHQQQQQPQQQAQVQSFLDMGQIPEPGDIGEFDCHRTLGNFQEMLNIANNWEGDFEFAELDQAIDAQNPQNFGDVVCNYGFAKLIYEINNYIITFKK